MKKSALTMRSEVYGRYVGLYKLMILRYTYEDKKKPVTLLCKIQCMAYHSPLTGARPGPKRIATIFHLRIPHGFNQNSTRTMVFDFREVELLITLEVVRTRRRRSNGMGAIARKPVDRLARLPTSHMWLIGEYSTSSAYMKSVWLYS